MMNQERSIFHSNGMPLSFSENAGVGRAQSPGWMSPFSIGRVPQTVSQDGGVSLRPALDGHDDQEESAPEVPDRQEQEAVAGEGSGLSADQVTPLPLPSSFSWMVGRLQPGFPPLSAARGQAGRSNQNSGWTGPEEHQESSSGSFAKGFSEPGQWRLPTLKTVLAAMSGQGPTAFTSSSVTREIWSHQESRRNAAAGKSAAHSSADAPAAHVEPWDDRQSQGIKALGYPWPAVVENSSSTQPSVKVTASPRTFDPDRFRLRARSTSVAGHNWITPTFSEQKLRPQVLTTSVAAKASAVEVLEKLSSGGSQAPAAAAPGRRVHISKLHITVQRPAGEAQPQQAPPAADARHASQPGEQVFFDPWERHYSNFD